MTIEVHWRPLLGPRYETVNERSANAPPGPWTRSKAEHSEENVGPLKVTEEFVHSAAINGAIASEATRHPLAALPNAAVAFPLNLKAALDGARKTLHIFRHEQPEAANRLQEQIDRLQARMKREGIEEGHQGLLSPALRFELMLVRQRAHELQQTRLHLLETALQTTAETGYSASMSLVTFESAGEVFEELVKESTREVVNTAGTGVSMVSQAIGIGTQVTKVASASLEAAHLARDRKVLQELQNLPRDVRDAAIAAINRELVYAGTNITLGVVEGTGLVCLFIGNAIALTGAGSAATPILNTVGISLYAPGLLAEMFLRMHTNNFAGNNPILRSALLTDGELADLIDSHGPDAAVQSVVQSQKMNRQTLAQVKTASFILAALDKEKSPKPGEPHATEEQRLKVIKDMAASGNKKIYKRTTSLPHEKELVESTCTNLAGTGILDGPPERVRLRLLDGLLQNPLIARARQTREVADQIQLRTAEKLGKKGDEKSVKAFGLPHGQKVRRISDTEYDTFILSNERARNTELEEGLHTLIKTSKDRAKQDRLFLAHQLALLAMAFAPESGEQSTDVGQVVVSSKGAWGSDTGFHHESPGDEGASSAGSALFMMNHSTSV